MKPLTNNPMEGFMNEWGKFNKLDIAMSKGEKISKDEFDLVLTKLQAVSDYAADPKGLPPIPGLGYISKITRRRLDIQLNRARKDTADPTKFKIEGGLMWRVDAQPIAEPEQGVSHETPIEGEKIV